MSAPANGQRAEQEVEIDLQTSLGTLKSPSSEIACINSRASGCCADLS